jgi:hypothetical protein
MTEDDLQPLVPADEHTPDMYGGSLSDGREVIPAMPAAVMSGKRPDTLIAQVRARRTTAPHSHHSAPRGFVKRSTAT